jgi:hypothetical protein
MPLNTCFFVTNTSGIDRSKAVHYVSALTVNLFVLLYPCFHTLMTQILFFN